MHAVGRYHPSHNRRQQDTDHTQRWHDLSCQIYVFPILSSLIFAHSHIHHNKSHPHQYSLPHSNLRNVLCRHSLGKNENLGNLHSHYVHTADKFLRTRHTISDHNYLLLLLLHILLYNRRSCHKSHSGMCIAYSGSSHIDRISPPDTGVSSNSL